jgi:hypothetical protein
MRFLLIMTMAAAALRGEAMKFQAEWRAMRAGFATLELLENHARLHLETTGFVGSLYHVNNDYRSSFQPSFCATETQLTAREGKKQRETNVTFQHPAGKATLVERDLLADRVAATREIDVPPCVHDVIAALAKVRTLRLAPGESIQLPLSDGKKSVSAKIDAQAEETVKTPAGQFKAQRFEAHLFNDVLYRRKGRLFFWLTPDERRLLVQIKVQLPFYLGGVTLRLEK